MQEPLAQKLRPKTIDEVIGQEHVTGPGKLLRRMVQDRRPLSLILWGPPGSGKTTLAMILAREMEAEFIELSATMAGKHDVTAAIEKAKEWNKINQRTVLFVDEIHRFNKAQQDTFLPHVESGLICLIGATTENPSFEVITPLLSRSRVIVLEPLSKEALKSILKRAIRLEQIKPKQVPTKMLDFIAEVSNGDARSALGTLELALQLAHGNPVSQVIVEEAAQRRLPDFDKQGEQHYNLISAFIKSLRGSNATAALYYMARMLQSGEDPKFIARRMIVFASEDIGLAAPAALNLAVATFQAIERVGLPEGQYNLYHCAAVLAKCKKSRSVAEAMAAAMKTARDYPALPVPLHLRNAPTRLMKDLGYQQGYDWQAGFQPEKGFLPPEISQLDFFKRL